MIFYNSATRDQENFVTSTFKRTIYEMEEKRGGLTGYAIVHQC